MYKIITLTDELRGEIKADLERYDACSAAADKEILFHFRTAWKSTIDALDPFWDAKSHSIAFAWYQAEDCGFREQEFREYRKVLDGLSRFGKAKITAPGTRYTVKDVPADILAALVGGMAELEKIRNSGSITDAALSHIRSIRTLIDCIDVNFDGYSPDEVPQGISLGERWASVEKCEWLHKGKYTETFEEYYTILSAVLANGKAKVRC